MAYGTAEAVPFQKSDAGVFPQPLEAAPFQNSMPKVSCHHSHRTDTRKN